MRLKTHVKTLGSRSILFAGVLCAAGCEQNAIRAGVAPFVRSHSNYQAIRSHSSLAGVSQRISAKPSDSLAANSPKHCGNSTKLLDFVVWNSDQSYFRTVPVWEITNPKSFYFVSRMTIDADGAPNAYNRSDTGLDALANAGGPDGWDGIITDRNGNPLIQQQADPFPGYYISCTSLSDKSKRFSDPTGYVDASKIPYIALPPEVADPGGARLGDFAVVVNLKNGKYSFAIYADIGSFGEGSVALAEQLGISSDARQGGQHDGVLYLLFPGSGNGRPRTLDEIRNQGKTLLQEWGGQSQLDLCSESESSSQHWMDPRLQ